MIRVLICSYFKRLCVRKLLNTYSTRNTASWSNASTSKSRCRKLIAIIFSSVSELWFWILIRKVLFWRTLWCHNEVDLFHMKFCPIRHLSVDLLTFDQQNWISSINQSSEKFESRLKKFHRGVPEILRTDQKHNASFQGCRWPGGRSTLYHRKTLKLHSCRRGHGVCIEVTGICGPEPAQ